MKILADPRLEELEYVLGRRRHPRQLSLHDGNKLDDDLALLVAVEQAGHATLF